jgi:hypothetical protein
MDTVSGHGIKRSSDEVLSFVCSHIGCNFHCGITIDGIEGSDGQCEKQKETPVDLSSSSEQTKT